MAVNRLTSLLNQKEIVDIFFWQTLGAVLQAALAPEMAALSQESFQLTPTLVLNAAQLADAVVRGHMDLKDAQQQARQGGLTEANFQVVVDSTGEPIPLETAMEAWRRGFIKLDDGKADGTSLHQVVKESRLYNKYFEVIQQLQFQLPPVPTVIEAWLRAVLEEKDALPLLYKAGVDQDTANLMYKSAGRPPSPQELITLMLRGIIPETGRGADVLSLEQGYLETDLKNKWWPVWKELAVYLPPPRTITALLRAQSITEATARDLFAKSGLPRDMIDAYVADASRQKAAAVKELAVGTVVNMYKAKELARGQALGFIVARGYDSEDANFLLDYADFQLVEAQVGALTTRIRTLYVGHKIQKQAAVDALANVGMTSEVISHLFTVWDQEAAASPVLLTTTQLANAAAKGWIDPLAAFEEIQGRGYDARDAWVLLAEHKTDMSDVPVPPGIIVKA